MSVPHSVSGSCICKFFSHPFLMGMAGVSSRQYEPPHRQPKTGGHARGQGANPKDPHQGKHEEVDWNGESGGLFRVSCLDPRLLSPPFSVTSALRVLLSLLRRATTKSELLEGPSMSSSTLN